MGLCSPGCGLSNDCTGQVRAGIAGGPSLLAAPLTSYTLGLCWLGMQIVGSP